MSKLSNRQEAILRQGKIDTMANGHSVPPYWKINQFLYQYFLVLILTQWEWADILCSISPPLMLPIISFPISQISVIVIILKSFNWWQFHVISIKCQSLMTFCTSGSYCGLCFAHHYDDYVCCSRWSNLFCDIPTDPTCYLIFPPPSDS